ncbi:MAG: hypothetical protein AABY46_06755 [Nitrospirota bacterium]
MRIQVVFAFMVVALFCVSVPMSRAQEFPPGLAGADTNKDVKLSKEEFLANAENRFKKMDANGDGFLTPDELPKGKGQGRNEGKGQGMKKQGMN